MEAGVVRWVWAGELETSELVLGVEKEQGEMVDGAPLHGALGALWGQGALHGELAEEAWQSLEEKEVL